MRNLVIFHLESASWQRVGAFPSAFPNIRRLFADARVYDWFIASATSTRMILAYLFHANDFEFDASSDFFVARPAVNNPDLFSILRQHGCSTSIICLDPIAPEKVHLSTHAGILPPVWVTAETPKLVEKFDELTNTAPFAIHVWNLISHIEHSQTLGSFGLTEQAAHAFAATDDAVGAFLSLLERKGLLESTTVVVYGDHGDDLWTHGFKGGLLHATEPYTDVVRVPLVIRDPGLAKGNDDRIASTIDIGPTCLDLLGIDMKLPFPESGRSLRTGEREFGFAQNFLGAQPDNPDWGIRKAFSVTDRNHTLLVSSCGLEFYAHRLDPGNHCNLLHFFDIDSDGGIALVALPAAHLHFKYALGNNPEAVERLSGDFKRLQATLRAKVTAKRSYIAERNPAAPALDPRCCGVANRDGREAFFANGVAAPASGLLRRILPFLRDNRAR
jgi:hypothetical protein